MTPKTLVTSDAVPTDISRSPYCQVTQSLLTPDAVPSDKSRSTPTDISRSSNCVTWQCTKLSTQIRTFYEVWFTKSFHEDVDEDTQLVATCGRELAPCLRSSQRQDRTSRCVEA
jgi:hypothetical protein